MNHEALIKHLEEAESRLKARGVWDSRFGIVFRSFLYFSHRKNVNNVVRKGRRGFLLAYFHSLWLSLVDLGKVRNGKSVAVIAPSQQRNIVINNKAVSKHADSLSDFVGKTFATEPVMVEIGILRSECDAVNVSALFRLMQRIVPSFLYVDRAARRFVQQAAEVLEELGIESKQALLEDVFRRYLFSRIFYKAVLPVKRLSRVYFINYYDPEVLGILHSLKSSGVTCLEYQHGIQNDLHPMYTRLDDVGHSVPDQFLTWNSVTTRRFEALNRFVSTSITEVGYLWPAYYSRVFGGSSVGRRVIEGEGPRILVALQLYPDFFNKDLLIAIDRLGERFTWVVREHPLSVLTPSERGRFLEASKRLSFDSETLLEEQLASSDLCITGFSTVGLEAKAFGCKVLFTHENALKGLSDYIDNVDFFYAGSVESMIDRITQLTSPNS